MSDRRWLAAAVEITAAHELVAVDNITELFEQTGDLVVEHCDRVVDSCRRSVDDGHVDDVRRVRPADNQFHQLALERAVTYVFLQLDLY